MASPLSSTRNAEAASRRTGGFLTPPPPRYFLNHRPSLSQVPDSDEDEQGLVTVGGKSVRAPSLALELSISQITAAARPALGCKVSPRLAQRGCELVVTLVREVSRLAKTSVCVFFFLCLHFLRRVFVFCPGLSCNLAAVTIDGTCDLRRFASVCMCLCMITWCLQ